MPTAKGWSAADIKRLTGPAATGPWLTLTVVVPVATKGTLNSREHWAARHKRVKGERLAIRSVLQAVEPVCPHGLYAAPRVRVTLTRINGGRMDSDNLAGALKGCRDEVAAWLGWDDDDPRFEWVYAQEPGRGPAQVRITFEAGA